MKKYLLLIIPILFFGMNILASISRFNLLNTIQAFLNLAIIMTIMIFLLKRTNLQNIMDWLVGIGFTTYICVLYRKTIELTFFFDFAQYTPKNLSFIFYSVNIVPFKGIMEVISNNPSPAFQIIGNALMLAPLAFALLYFKWVKNSKQAIFYSFLCTILIEIIQFLHNILSSAFSIGMGRSTDIDDILLNTLGAVIGVGCYKLWITLKNTLTKKNSTSYSQI